MYSYHTVITKEYEKELRKCYRFLNQYVDFFRYSIITLVFIFFIIMKAWLPLGFMLLVTIPVVFLQQIVDFLAKYEKKQILIEEGIQYIKEYTLNFSEEYITYNHLIRKTKIKLLYSALNRIAVTENLIVLTTFSRKIFVIERNQVESENELFEFIELKNPNIQIYR